LAEVQTDLRLDPPSVAKHGPLHAQTLELAVDLDRAAVAGAVAARHWRLPGELGVRRGTLDRAEHRLRPARENVPGAFGQHVRDENGVEDDLGAGQERRRLGVKRGPKAEHGRSAAE